MFLENSFKISIKNFEGLTVKRVYRGAEMAVKELKKLRKDAVHEARDEREAQIKIEEEIAKTELGGLHPDVLDLIKSKEVDDATN